MNRKSKATEFIVHTKNPRADIIAAGAIKGDLVSFTNRSYRNEGLWIFDGTDIVRIDDSIDDYGALPTEFTINDGYPPTYWVDPRLVIIDHLGVHESDTPGEGFAHGNYVHLELSKNNISHINNIERKPGQTYETIITCGDQDIKVSFEWWYKAIEGLISVELDDDVIDLTDYSQAPPDYYL